MSSPNKWNGRTSHVSIDKHSNPSGPRSGPTLRNPFKVNFNPSRFAPSQFPSSAPGPSASAHSASSTKKRRASRSPDREPQEPESDLALRKKRFIVEHGAASQPGKDQVAQVASPINPLVVLANAAASASKLPTPTPSVGHLSAPSVDKADPRLRDSSASEIEQPLPVSTQTASMAHFLAPISVKKIHRRLVLISSPFPSPLIAAKKFDLLAALMSHVDILINIASYLSPPTLLNLYSISAPFHYLMDSHFTSFIMACTRTWAPNADKFFPWWCYRQLCIEDPAQRPARQNYRNVSWTNKHGLPVRSTTEAYLATSKEGEGWNLDTDPSLIRPLQPGQTRDRIVRDIVPADKDTAAIKKRDVPSFRWLEMVAYRESVSREIIGWLAVHGHRIPRHEGVAAVKKMWFLMDMPINGPRIAVIHNTAYFTADTLIVLQTLFIKLDMLYTDPLRSSGGEYRMREMLLSERSLTTLWNYLRGADGTSRLDVVRLWIRHGYKRRQPPQPMTEQQQREYDARLQMPIMGVPPQLVGRWSYECWGLSKYKLLRPDELVAKEGVRRRLGLQREYLRMISSGYLGLGLEALPVVKKEDVVLSLIRRRKNNERLQKQQEQQEDRTEGKGKWKERAVEQNETMGEVVAIVDEATEEAQEIENLHKLVMMHLTA